MAILSAILGGLTLIASIVGPSLVQETIDYAKKQDAKKTLQSLESKLPQLYKSIANDQSKVNQLYDAIAKVGSSVDPNMFPSIKQAIVGQNEKLRNDYYNQIKKIESEIAVKNEAANQASMAKTTLDPVLAKTAMQTVDSIVDQPSVETSIVK